MWPAARSPWPAAPGPWPTHFTQLTQFTQTLTFAYKKEHYYLAYYKESRFVKPVTQSIFYAVQFMILFFLLSLSNMSELCEMDGPLAGRGPRDVGHGPWATGHGLQATFCP